MCPDHAGQCKCARWHYEKFDGRGKKSKVFARCVTLLADLKDGRIDRQTELRDTGPTHKRLFGGLTKKGCEYFAGSFRGSRGCLIDYEVVINTAAGQVQTTKGAMVAQEMQDLSAQIQNDLLLLDSMGGPDSLESRDDLVNWLDVALERMIKFLSIHPYADGNGHISRFLMFCYLSAAGVWPNNWPLDDHPPHPYDEAIAAFRNGYVDGLRDYMLDYIDWPSPNSQ